MDREWTWIDTEYYPGPDSLTESQPPILVGIAASIQRIIDRQTATKPVTEGAAKALREFVGVLTGPSSRLAPSHHHIHISFRRRGGKSVLTAIEEASETTRDRALRLKQERNHGPVAETTFDRYGRRRR